MGVERVSLETEGDERESEKVGQTEKGLKSTLGKGESLR